MFMRKMRMTVTDTKWMINVDQVLNYDPFVDYIL